MCQSHAYAHRSWNTGNSNNDIPFLFQPGWIHLPQHSLLTRRSTRRNRSTPFLSRTESIHPVWNCCWWWSPCPGTGIGFLSGWRFRERHWVSLWTIQTSCRRRIPYSCRRSGYRYILRWAAECSCPLLSGMYMYGPERQWTRYSCRRRRCRYRFWSLLRCRLPVSLPYCHNCVLLPQRYCPYRNDRRNSCAACNRPPCR